MHGMGAPLRAFLPMMRTAFSVNYPFMPGMGTLRLNGMHGLSKSKFFRIG